MQIRCSSAAIDCLLEHCTGACMRTHMYTDAWLSGQGGDSQQHSSAD